MNPHTENSDQYNKAGVKSDLDAFSRLAMEQIREANSIGNGPPNHSHAWRGTWNRPMHIDENTPHPFTIARMTDHNVRGTDN